MEADRMATTCYFDEVITDQDGEYSMSVEFGRSSYYAGAQTKSGIGQDSVYLKVEDKTVIMDLDTARKFVEAALSVGRYHGIVD
jgi:hypothetical protein